jgi:hypothetical protein
MSSKLTEPWFRDEEVLCGRRLGDLRRRSHFWVAFAAAVIAGAAAGGALRFLCQ